MRATRKASTGAAGSLVSSASPTGASQGYCPTDNGIEKRIKSDQEVRVGNFHATFVHFECLSLFVETFPAVFNHL